MTGTFVEYAAVAAAALLASGLTFFSGFGLGTLLMPVFALFFPLETAIPLTAVVHLLNNFFKLALVGRHVHRASLLLFGLPAMAAAFLGARALFYMAGQEPLISYTLMGRPLDVEPMKLVIASLIITFSLFDVLPVLKRIQFEKKFLPVGGLLSGFIGGLSGLQGALRSAFLIKCGLSKEAFIATGVAIACVVDLSRLSVYAPRFREAAGENIGLLLTAVVAAFSGAFVGSRLLGKMTLKSIQTIVAVMLFAIAVGLAMGLI